MIIRKEIVLIIAVLAAARNGQQLTCAGDFSFRRYAGGDRFLSSIVNRSYDCSCRGVGCEQITCIVLESVSERVAVKQTCRDPKTGRSYARGTSFVRHGQNGVNSACTCPSFGRLKIECKQPQCVIPPPPPPTQARLRNVKGSCYDRHNDDWHPHNVPYTRKVIMSYAPDIIGEYRCTCNSLSTRCSAIDMPCCDVRTGQFVGKNERFVAQLDGLPMNCMCLGGRGRVGLCEQLHDPREIGRSQRIRKKRCLDKTANRYYHEGAVFLQIRRRGERQCSCKRQKRQLKIICKPRYRPGA